ncbi:hypothetical protein [Limobrevibacterium gyesilva]|uniref:Uncharacterized protein n=1 Tax=Limobrevibacterium gyesilva TaxID=2991712 RepID=A0AA41YWJ5_9PROT|nr:hypothetical protein [Limobrevibacterium gyesilva]MCW3477685.1 hypothetical protein [Limobrevibacterium gyesilva]
MMIDAIAQAISHPTRIFRDPGNIRTPRADLFIGKLDRDGTGYPVALRRHSASKVYHFASAYAVTSGDWKSLTKHLRKTRPRGDRIKLKKALDMETRPFKGAGYPSSQFQLQNRVSVRVL